MPDLFYSRVLPLTLYVLAAVLIAGLFKPEYETVFVADSIAFPDGRELVLSEHKSSGDQVVIPRGSFVMGHTELRQKKN